jgi:pantetheine-phosphate adenylyltransferase
MSKIAIYPGTFDPITFGHLDILQRASKVFDKVIVGIAANTSKNTLFSIEERFEIAKKEVSGLNISNVTVRMFEGLLIEFVKNEGAKIIVRGLRAVSDFEFEFQMSYMNHKMSPEIETVFLPATENSHFISSSFVKQIALLHGNLDGLVSDYVSLQLRNKI